MDDWHWNLLFFQMMFAAIATIIVSGAMAERIHFVAYVVSAAMVRGLIYPVFGSRAWGSIVKLLYYPYKTRKTFEIIDRLNQPTILYAYI